MPDSDSANPRVTDRRKYDLVGNVPQWITTILLAIIGSLILMIWNSLERRVTVVEEQITIIAKDSAGKNVEVESLRMRTNTLENAIAELKAQQASTTAGLNTLTTQVTVLNNQLIRAGIGK